VRVVSDILSSSYGVKSKALAPTRQSSMDDFLAGISSEKPSDSYDLDAWMPGKKSKGKKSKGKKSKGKKSKGEKSKGPWWDSTETKKATETSGPYELDKVYKEKEKGYKKQKVHKVGTSGPYNLDKLFKEPKKPKKKRSKKSKKKRSKKSGGFFGLF